MDYKRIDQNLMNSHDSIWKIKSSLHVRTEIIKRNPLKLEYKDKLIQHVLGEYACLEFTKLISTKEKKSKIQRALNIWKHNLEQDKNNSSKLSKEELQKIINQLNEISQDSFVLTLVKELRDKHIAHNDVEKRKTISVDFEKLVELVERIRRIIEPLLEIRKCRIFAGYSNSEVEIYRHIIGNLYST